MTDAEFQSQALDYAPPGTGPAASAVTTGEPSAEPFPAVPGDPYGPAAPAIAPVDPAVGPSTPGFAPTPFSGAPVAPPAHGQQVQTVRTVTPAPGEAEALNAARASGKAAAEAGADIAVAKKDQTEASARAAEDAAVQDRLDAQEAADKAAELEARESEARAKMDAAEQDVAGFKFHDFVSSKSVGDQITGKMFTALGLLFGGDPKIAAEKVQKDIDRDFDRQKLDLMSKENIAKWRREGVTDASAKMKEEMGALYLRQSKMHQATASKALAMAIRSGMPVEEAENNALVKGQIAAADKAYAKSLESFRGSVTTQYGTAKAGKGAGGGSGSGANIAKFVDAVNALKPGDKVTPEIYELGRHAGYKANQIGTEVDRIRNTGNKSVTGEGKADKAGQEDVKDVDKRAEETKKELYNPKGPGTQYDRLKGMSNLVTHALAAGDKTAMTSVLEEAGGMLSGGKTTKLTKELFDEIKTTGDELSEKWGRIVGNPGATKAYTDRINNLLGRVKQEKLDEIKDIRGRYVETELGVNGLAREGKRKERVLGHAAMFGDANGPAASVTSGGIPAGAIRGKMNGQAGYVLNGEFHAL